MVAGLSSKDIIRKEHFVMSGAVGHWVRIHRQCTMDTGLGYIGGVQCTLSSHVLCTSSFQITYDPCVMRRIDWAFPMI